MRTRVRGKSVGSGAASMMWHFLQPEVRPRTSGEKVIGLVSAALIMSLAGCDGDKSQTDGNTLGQAQAATGNVGGDADISGTVAQLLAAGLNESDPALQGMQRLSDAEISQVIVGRMLIEDRRGLRGMPYPQGERFFPGGVVAIQLDRIEARGTYSIQSNALCITVARAPGSSCRALYRNRDGHLFQVFYGLDGRTTPISIV
jgi:hypothetical protein